MGMRETREVLRWWRWKEGMKGRRDKRKEMANRVTRRTRRRRMTTKRQHKHVRQRRWGRRWEAGAGMEMLCSMTDEKLEGLGMEVAMGRGGERRLLLIGGI